MFNIGSYYDIMACQLFGGKPLLEVMLTYCHLDPKEQTSVKFEIRQNDLHSRKHIWQHYMQMLSILLIECVN